MDNDRRTAKNRTAAGTGGSIISGGHRNSPGGVPAHEAALPHALRSSLLRLDQSQAAGSVLTKSNRKHRQTSSRAPPPCRVPQLLGLLRVLADIVSKQNQQERERGL